MCGRYTTIETEKLYPRYKTVNRLDKDKPASYNVAPGQWVPIITAQSPNHISLMKWGFVPPWVNDAEKMKKSPKPINAKAENLSTSPLWRGAFKNHRCLVPATGFYEWKGEAGRKQPYWFHLKHERIFSFAGLFSVAHDAEGKEFASFTIITTRPNQTMRPIHDRMPVILAEDKEADWLSGEADPGELMAMLDPYDDSDMERFAVSPDVNTTRNNAADLIKPIKSK